MSSSAALPRGLLLLALTFHLVAAPAQAGEVRAVIPARIVRSRHGHDVIHQLAARDSLFSLALAITGRWQAVESIATAKQLSSTQER